MTISMVETKHMGDFPSGSGEIAPRRLLEADNLAAVLVNVDAGQSIEPCLMSATVWYYVIEGSSSLIVEDEQADLQTGSLALVPAGTVRSISAGEATRILAVQVK